MPSRFEPFGIIALEGMAAGVPVVVSNTDGLKEIVRNEKNGLYTDHNKIDDISKVVIRLLSDKTLAKKLSSGAKKRVKMFKWDEIAKKTLEVYCKAEEKARFE